MTSNTNKEVNTSSSSGNSKGYLVCEKCKGRYELQDDESLEDFESCECGGSLKYFEYQNPESNGLDVESVNRNVAESNEIETENNDEIVKQRIVKLLKTGTLQEKDGLKEASKRNAEDEILGDIGKNDWVLWDLLREKNVQNDAKNQKLLLNEAIKQEEQFSMLIKEQNKRVDGGNANSVLKNGWIYVTVFFAIVFVIIFMALNKV